MILLTLAETARAAGGRQVNGDPALVIKGVSTDTRNIAPGDLFIALKGERFDGHDFLPGLADRKPGALMVSSDFTCGFAPVIRVADTLQALGALAGYVRNKTGPWVFCVTGSNGKTTTKEMLNSILSATGKKTLKSEGNFNNLVGLPLTIFRLDGTEDYLVLELGMSAPGEIFRLAEIASPDYGAITNVGPSHLEHFSSVEDIGKAKKELARQMRENTYLAVNADSEYLSDAAEHTKASVFTFGIENKSDFKMDDIVRSSTGYGFSVNGIKGFGIETIAYHNLYNALAATALARCAGISWEIIKEGLAGFSPHSMRMQEYSFGGIRVINDCYNSNPLSLEAALKTMGSIKGGRRVAVLGDMLELGAASGEYHKKAGKSASENCDALFTYGPMARFIVEGFTGPGREAWHFDDKAALLEKLSSYLKTGDSVLVKGSRGMKMEDVFGGLRDKFGKKAGT